MQKRKAALACAALSMFALAGCGGGSSPTPTVTESRTVTETVATPATTPSVGAPSPSAAPGVEAQSWTMPNLVGRNLQDAQDEIQALSGGAVFFSGSTDLTGQGRNQIMDANWQVCTSTPAPGAPIDATTRIDFGVVRIGSETCP
jgi:hypothetical protein